MLRFSETVLGRFQWSGIREAKTYASKCAQVDLFTRKVMGAEDCLYLNVFTTNLNCKPVMVWIHGGAFFCGAGDDDFFGPDYLIEKDIVLVTINYRLGILGFLNLDDEEASGNQGLKDQVMALKWVQQNIAQFGGDPNNVTIFGESAGGASVHYLNLSPLARGFFDKFVLSGLFHKSIIQSGVATNPWAFTIHSPKEAAVKISSVLGNKTTDTQELIKYLRTVDVIELAKAEHEIKSMKEALMFENPFVPSVDLKSKTPFLTIPVHEAAKSGIKLPHMIGYTSQEGIFILSLNFFDFMKDDDYSKIEDNLNTLLLHEHMKNFLQERKISAGDVKKFFLGDKKISRENAPLVADLFSATLILINIHHALEAQHDAPTYLYKFDYYSKETAAMQKLLDIDVEGTCHAEDLIYLFRSKLLEEAGIKQIVPGTTEHVIRQQFLELWTNFAKTGNPNSETSELINVEWKPLDSFNEYN
ncbi:GSCOCT00007467001.2-RA-CDS, partial [Cotesia congregata]